MLESIGTAFSSLPELVLVRDLEAFEYPILSELRAVDRRGLYLEKWCTRDSTADRTLIVKTDQRYIAEYLARRIPMLDLLLASNDGTGFLVDREDGVIQQVLLVALQSLPPKYLPKPTALHDERLRPEWDHIPHSFLLESDWDATVLATLERRYLNVASFSFFTQPGKQRSLPYQILEYQYKGGYPFVGAFKSIRDAVPPSDRIRSVGVSANSPGVLTMESPASIATHLEENLSNVARAKKQYDLIHEWSRLNPDKIDGIPATALKELEIFCHQLGVDIGALIPGHMQQSPKAVLTAAKLVTSFYRQLQEVLEPVSGDEFIGLPSEAAT